MGQNLLYYHLLNLLVNIIINIYWWINIPYFISLYHIHQYHYSLLCTRRQLFEWDPPDFATRQHCDLGQESHLKAREMVISPTNLLVKSEYHEISWDYRWSNFITTENAATSLEWWFKYIYIYYIYIYTLFMIYTWGSILEWANVPRFSDNAIKIVHDFWLTRLTLCISIRVAVYLGIYIYI